MSNYDSKTLRLLDLCSSEGGADIEMFGDEEIEVAMDYGWIEVKTPCAFTLTEKGRDVIFACGLHGGAGNG